MRDKKHLIIKIHFKNIKNEILITANIFIILKKEIFKRIFNNTI
jgi:hypothetical protein